MLARWRALQAGDPALASPYFCPEFTQAVAAVRDDVYVSVIADAGQVVGFFPHQRGRFGAGTPAGGRLSDFHGLIGPADLPLDAEALLRGCGLTTYDFHYLVATQRVFSAGQALVGDSHYIDLSAGFPAYLDQLRAGGSGLPKDFGYKQRKLGREVGPLRFTPHEPDPAPLRQLIAWKRAQYQRAGLVDVFAFDWTRALLERLHAMQTAEFGGMLSTLHAGDALVAVHFGMRSQSVWNWWFPRHDERFARYSPGILLRLLAAERAAAFGVTRIDLGQGDDDTYKPRLRSGGIAVAAGTVERASWSVALRHARQNLEAAVRRSPLMPLVRIPGRVLKRLERRGRFA